MKFSVLYLKFMSRVYHYLKSGHRKYLEMLYRSSPNVIVGEKVRFPYVESAPPQYGTIEIGRNSWIGGTVNMFPHNEDAMLRIGEDCYIGDKCRIWCAKRIVIGNRVLIAHNVNIFDTNTHPIDPQMRYTHEKVVKNSGIPKEVISEIGEKEVVIDDDAWIGCNSIILKGVKIGKGCIVAAGSVVTKDTPPFSIVAGNPAKVVKYLEQGNGEKAGQNVTGSGA